MDGQEEKGDCWEGERGGQLDCVEYVVEVFWHLKAKILEMVAI